MALKLTLKFFGTLLCTIGETKESNIKKLQLQSLSNIVQCTLANVVKGKNYFYFHPYLSIIKFTSTYILMHHRIMTVLFIQGNYIHPVINAYYFKIVWGIFTIFKRKPF